MPRVKVEPPAEDGEPPAPQRELADGLRRGGRAGEPQAAAEFGVEAAPGDEYLVAGVDGQVERQRARTAAGRGRRRQRLLPAPSPRPTRSCA